GDATSEVGIVAFDVVAIFAAGLALEVVLAVGIETSDPLVVQIEPTEQAFAGPGHRDLQWSIGARRRTIGTPSVATRIMPPDPSSGTNPGFGNCVKSGPPELVGELEVVMTWSFLG